jgi:SAM-dependent methyltransferase
MTDGPRRCWVCDARALVLKKPSDVSAMQPEDFAISDARYGRTAAVYQCQDCGFLECADMSDVVSYYEALEDRAYMASRPERLLQARRLLQDVARMTGCDLRGLRLLDVGAGSGPLVEEALAGGVRAEGVEPSQWLCARATALGLPVHHGVLPHRDVSGPFDVVTLVDVIEHTTDPVSLLRHAAAEVAPGGVVVLVTPDVSSVAARLLGWRWWHFRLAHVGYYSRGTLERLCQRAGLRAASIGRPGWVLPLPYLLERVERYLPFRLPRVRRLASVAVPFNLRDSILLIARRA